MHIDEFMLERYQSLYEHTVGWNLTESGVHPLSLRELLDPEEAAALLDTPLGYAQTNGMDALRSAVAALHPGAGPENVLITTGSAEANLVAMWSLLEPGDEVVLMLPNYMQIWGIARALGATVRPIHLIEGRDWHADLDELARLVGPRTKLIVICNPNNPTGSVMGTDELTIVAGIAERAGVVLYADEIYRGAERDGCETPTCYGLVPASIVAGGLSKAYGLPGLRIGWLVGPADVIETAWRFHDYTTIAAGTIDQVAATAALRPQNRRRLLERGRALINANVPMVEDWVQRHPSFRMVPPRAGGMAFLGYEAPIGSTRLAELARKRHDVLIVPGDAYGMDGYARLGVGGDREELSAGLEQLSALMDGLDATNAVPGGD